MRKVTDDALPTVSTRHLAVVSLLVMMTVLVTPSTHGSSSSNTRMENGSVVYHVRVMFLCDETSNEYFCGVNLTNEELFKLFSKTGDQNTIRLDDCDETKTFCNNHDNFTVRNNTSEFEYYMDSNHVILSKRLSDTVSVVANATFHVLDGSVRSKIEVIDDLVDSESIDVIVAIGNFMTVQTSAIVAEGHGITILGYISDYGTGPKNVQGATYVSMNPGTEAQGKALSQIIGEYNLKQTTIIIEKSKYADGFLTGVRNSVRRRKQDVFNVLPLDPNVDIHILRQKLTDLSNKGWKMIVLHCSPHLMMKVVTIAHSTRLYNTGYAWFLSEMAFSRQPKDLPHLPGGLLAIESFWLGGMAEVMVKALKNVISATACTLGHESSSCYQQVPFSERNIGDTWGNVQFTDKSTNDDVLITNLKDATDFSRHFQRCLHYQIMFCSNISADDSPNNNETYTDPLDTVTFGGFRSMSSNVSPEVPTRNVGPAFNLLNTVDDAMGDRIWAKVGYITASGERDLKTVLWPGHNIYGPSSSVVKTYRVVTRAAEPFVFINPQVSRKEDCFVEVPCLQVDNSSQALLSAAVDDFQMDMKYVNQLYTVHCCKGLALEMLDALANDLNFRYVVYFVNDSNYGTRANNVWTGMVGDIVSGAADIIAGAFSITSERMNVMDFTEPFYQNKFSVVTGEGGSYVSIWAFVSPFSGQVWLCIFFSSIVAGVATAFLEWHSPFGLNPRGRKRTKNYGLGSGLLMVMVLLTGHTINIKAPKSWPGKVIQNMWAGLAIFIMTSYTANLAAYLAGQSAVTTVTSVYDGELLTKRVAIIPSSAVESFVEKINPKLSQRAQMNYVDSTITAINMLRERSIDVYLDDTPLLEYGLAKYDKDCKVRFAGPGKGFGSDGYAFGLARQSWLQIPMSGKILGYTESGYIQELARKYLSRPQCEHFLAGTANPYGLEHTGGLFIILLSAMCLAMLFHLLEHLAYRYLVPWLRKQPPESFWKTENLAFISQRVFRVVRSEKLYSQKQAAQEMIKIVKQRDFTRLIQKHELQKRRATTQKRIKTKAEVFQEITANIVSYHRQLQSTSEMADSSDVDSDKIEDIVADVIDGLDSSSIGVNNSAYNTDPSDLVLDMFFRRRVKRTSNDDNYESDTDNRILYPHDIMFEEQMNGTVNDGRIRKLSSRSWCIPGKQRDESMFRKHSDSYVIYPSSQEQGLRVLPNYTGSRIDNSKDSSTLRPTNNNDVEKNNSKCHSARIFHTNESCWDGNLSNTEYSNAPANIMQYPALPVAHEFPQNSRGNVYYQSSTSSSVQSPSDEKREFSPFSSPTSENTDDFPSCGESLESLAAIPQESRKTLVLSTHVGDPQDLVAQRRFNQSQVSTSPVIVIQEPSEITLNPLELDNSVSGQQFYPYFKQDSSAPVSYKIEKPQSKSMPRSKSTGLFSFKAPQKSGIDFLDVQYKTSLESDIDYSVVGISSNHDRRRESSLSDAGINNGVFTVEGANAHGVIRALRKSSDISPIRSQSQMSEQQNNTRRTKSYDKSSRDYFKRNIKLKDNRVKSTLRRHAMSGYQSHLPADFIDECTLEALSKEDVLILWKKSEIDLESRLHEVLARNRRLGLAIDYLTRRDRSEEPEEV